MINFKKFSSYEDIYDYKMIKKIPIIIKLNGRSFFKLTSLLQKPFDFDFFTTISNVILKIVHEIDGATFAYSFNDEIYLLVKNDKSEETQAWYDNKIQSIASVSASIASMQFYKSAQEIGLQLIGDPIFISNCFCLPNIDECVDFFILKQQEAYISSIKHACYYELNKTYNSDDVKSILKNTTYDQKIDILEEKCNLSIDQYEPIFRKGFASYRTPKLYTIGDVNEIKYKFTIDNDLVNFSKDRSFLNNIFTSGKDIWRNFRDKSPLKKSIK